MANSLDVRLPSEERGRWWFARSLACVLPRLDLMGYTLEAARQYYLAAVQGSIETSSMDGDEPPCDVMGFEEFCQFACRRPLAGLDQTVDLDNNEAIARNFGFEQGELKRLLFVIDRDFFWSEPSYLSATTCFLNPYSMLQVFGRIRKTRVLKCSGSSDRSSSRDGLI